MGLNDGQELFLQFTGNTNDSSGNGNNATNNGATLTSDKNSVSNQAYSFDGVNDWMDTKDWSGDNIKSLSFWGYIDSTGSFDGNTCYFSDINTSPAEKYLIFRIWDSGNRIKFQKNTGFTTGDLTRVNNTWEHFVATLDGTNFRFYRDGVLIVETASSDTTLLEISEVLTLARQTFDSSYAKVRLDEFRLYSRTLTDVEVVQLYEGYDTDADFVDTLGAYNQGKYKFTGNVLDSSGNSRNLTDNGSTSVADKNAVSGQARSVNGSNTDVRRLDNYGVTGTACTINIWVKLNAEITTGAWALCELSDTSTFTRNVIQYNYNGGSQTLQVNRQQENVANNYVTANTGGLGTSNWNMITYWYDGTTLKLYLNAVFQGELATSGNGSSGINNNVFVIGTGYGANSDVNDANISFDEASVYNRAVTETELLQMFASYDAPVNEFDTLDVNLRAEYQFTGNVNDTSGNGFNLTDNGTSSTTDKNGAVDQARQTSATTSLDVNTQLLTGSAQSYSIWLYPTNIGVYNVIYRQMVGGADRSLLLDWDGTQVSIGLSFTSAGSFDASYTSATGILTQDVWNHLVFIRDGTDVEVYVNAIQKTVTLAGGSGSTSALRTMSSPFSTLSLSSGGWQGKKDEVRPFNRRLTPFEITQLFYEYDFDGGSPPAGGDDTSAVFFSSEL